jgi:1-acyl-sn-glycerol-3-phosphate acyltransferase/ketosteroid isomerase-like protein
VTDAYPVHIPDPLPEAQFDRLVGVLEPLERLTRPRVYGLERVPEGGALLVGNHTLYGFVDLPFMLAELWKRRRIRVRGLGEHAHYAIPVWRNLLELCGMVRGTRENVRALMREHEYILVFPGGAGEVFKHRGERYRLLWKERMGFARLAIEHGYPIVPFAAVGAEEMLDIVADNRVPVVAQVSNLMKRLVGISLPPLVRGIGPTALPRPERLYFWFGEPIDTTRFAGRYDDDAVRALRDETKRAVEDGIKFLRTERDADPNRGLAARLRAKPDLPRLPTGVENAAFVRKAYEAWNTGGPRSAAAWASSNVELEDPPGWPDAAVWRGRDAVLDRLEEVTTSLGGRWAEIEDARTVGDEVLVSMALRSSRACDGAPLGHFHQLVLVQADEITRIRVFLDEESAMASRA